MGSVFKQVTIRFPYPAGKSDRTGLVAALLHSWWTLVNDLVPRFSCGGPARRPFAARKVR